MVGCIVLSVGLLFVAGRIMSKRIKN